MKKLLPLLLVPAFVVSCGDPDAPSRYLTVDAPAWTGDVNIARVSKHSCIIQGDNEERIWVSRSGTDLGNGLVADRDFWDCYVTEQSTGVECNWNSGEQLDWCRVPNPAYAEYQAQRRLEQQ